jgi:hypothetical protein
MFRGPFKTPMCLLMLSLVSLRFNGLFVLGTMTHITWPDEPVIGVLHAVNDSVSSI